VRGRGLTLEDPFFSNPAVRLLAPRAQLDPSSPDLKASFWDARRRAGPALRSSDRLPVELPRLRGPSRRQARGAGAAGHRATDVRDAQGHADGHRSQRCGWLAQGGSGLLGGTGCQGATGARMACSWCARWWPKVA
jgi:hypothetical protein